MPKIPPPMLVAASFLLAASVEAQEPAAGPGPNPADRIVTVLVAQGFENVGIESEAERTTVWFENRKYRYEMAALGVAAALAARELDPATVLELIPQNRNVPLLALAAPAGDWLGFLDASLGAGAFLQRLVIRTGSREGGRALSYPGPGKRNRSTFRTDLAVRPLFSVQVGAPNRVFEYTLAVAPEATASPFRGGLATLQAAWVIHDDLDPCGKEEPCGADLKPVRNTLSWGGWLPGGWMTTWSGGMFPGDRWGFAGQVGKLTLDGRLEVWAKGDVSGRLQFLEDVILYSDLSTWTAYGALTYRFSGLDLVTTVRGWRFSEGVAAARVDFERRFHEFEVGFFGIKNEYETTAGFTLKIPLPVREYLDPAPVRPTTVPKFPFYYQDTVGAVAVELSMFDNLDRLRKRLYPPFIRTNIEDLRRGNRYLEEGGSP